MPLTIDPIQEQSKFPVEKKPSLDPNEKAIYSDVFSLQNAFRILFLVLDNTFKKIQDYINTSGTGVPEAPVDGTVYGRKDAAWTAVSGSSPASSTVVFTSNTALSGATRNVTTEGDITWYNVASIRKRGASRIVDAANMPVTPGVLTGWGFASDPTYNAGDVLTSGAAGSFSTGVFSSYTSGAGFQLAIRFREGINVVRLYVSNGNPFTVNMKLEGSTSTATSGAIVSGANMVLAFTVDCKVEGQIGYIECIAGGAINLAFSFLTIGTS